MPPLPDDLWSLIFNLGPPTVILFFVIYWLGTRLDKLTDAVNANTFATNRLAAWIEARWPLGRPPA